jgi:cell division protein FtsQ
MIVLLTVVVAAVVWANLWKQDMRVGDITVDGNAIIAEEEILSIADIRKNQKLYTVDLHRARERLMTNAFVRTASVNREAPNRITILIEERVPLAAVVLGRLEYIDAEGMVLPPTRSENLFDLPVLTGEFREGEFVPGRQVSGGRVREALGVLVAARRIGDEAYRRISEVHVGQNGEMILYLSEYGVPVVLGNGDAGVKLVKLDGFWKEVLPHHGAHELVYMDLRFEDQVVVRWKHDTAEQQTTDTTPGTMIKTKNS